jgi:ParB-like chromosome segregation protein Spo0J
MVQKHSRQFEAVEQAIMIQELMQRCHLSRVEISQLLGRNPGWVSRRISLVESLDDKVLQDVMKGKISVWAATRVLVPLARANSEHSQKLGNFLRVHSPSTRDVDQLWKYYQKASKSQRERVVESPDSFLKSLREQQNQKDSKKLKNGIEGKWLHDVSVCKSILQRMRKNTDELFSPSQNAGERNRLKAAFDGLAKVFEELENAVGKEMQ